MYFYFGALMYFRSGVDTITVAAILAGQLDDGRAQNRFFIPHHPRLALGRARLANRAAGPPLRNAQLLLQMRDTLASAFRA